jgi:hypothetical protein
VVASRFHGTIRSTLELRFENGDLIRDLTAAKNQADALNESLKKEIIERKRTEARFERAKNNWN